jgi:hypothetical protein
VLPRWNFDTDFLRLLASFERMLPLRKPSSLHDASIATRLHSMSEGYLGELSTLLNLAAIAAVQSGCECIAPGLLSELKWVAPTDRRRQAERVL